MTRTSEGLARFRHLLAPLRIGGIEVRNRVVSTAHLTNFALDGVPTERHRAYWAEKARGGVGLIITEGSLVHPSSRTPETRFIEFWRDAVIDPLRRVSDEVHEHGARIVAQLNHMGMSWSPSDVPRADGRRPHAMSGSELAEVRDAFADAADRARQGGVDGVEVHLAHNYLLEQFLSPLTNRRTDDYGGSEQNRLRFPIEVLAAVRERVGPDFVVGVRVGGDQFTRGGLDQADMQRLTASLAAAVRLDFINVSFYRSTKFGPAGNSIVPMYVPEGQFVYLAAGIKATTRLPVICVNRIVDPVMAEQILARGDADMVAMTRAQIADPHLVAKVNEGRLEEIRPCIGINAGCLGQVMSGAATPMTCAVNPGAGQERAETRPRPARVARKVMVVGGGIAGMELARLCAERGHTVELYERAERLGGQLLVAAAAPGLSDMAKPVAYFERQFDLLGVEVHRGVDVDADTVRSAGPDVVVVATGSSAADPDDHLLACADSTPWTTAREVLASGAPGARHVLVYATDQTLEPLAAADALASAGARVTFAVPYPALGGQVETQARPLVLDRLRAGGARTVIRAQWERPSAGKPRVSTAADPARPLDTHDVDLVVFALGAVARPDLVAELSDFDGEVHLIGDSYSPGQIVAATQQAYEIGCAL